jgi:putative ATP-binding cassette transporter
MQTAQAFGRLQDNLSFFRTAYDSFATYRATLDRLSGFTIAIEQACALPQPDVRADGSRLALENLTVKTPANALLLENLSLEVLPGAPLLIRGPSGSGKTTLLRAIAGLWPYCEGSIVRPEHKALFLSQKPYLPLGSLRDALYYPQQLPSLEYSAPIANIRQQQNAAIASAHGAPSNLDELATARRADLGFEPENSSAAPTYPLTMQPTTATISIRERTALTNTAAGPAQYGVTSERAVEVLRLVQLGHLVDRLDQVADWGRILSLGEQQRLAFGRVLLARPVAVFLDEATSAMDEGLEEAMYCLIRDQLPETILVSVGHRSTLFRHHPQQLLLKGHGTGAWELALS